MWPVPGLPPLGSPLALVRDRKRDADRHMDFWKLFFLYLLISFVCRGMGVWAHEWHSSRMEVRGQFAAASSPSALWVLGIKLRSPDLVATLTFTYPFFFWMCLSLSSAWEVVTVFSGSLVQTLSCIPWALFWSISMLSQWVLVMVLLTSIRRHW